MDLTKRHIDDFDAKFPEKHADYVVLLAQKDSFLSWLIPLISLPAASISVFFHDGQICGYSVYDAIKGMIGITRDTTDIQIIDAGKNKVDVTIDGKLYYCSIKRLDSSRTKSEIKHMLLNG